MRSITKQDFAYTQLGYGKVQVIYTSPKTGKEYKAITTNMQLIDAVKFEDEPLFEDLKALRRVCKQ